MSVNINIANRQPRLEYMSVLLVFNNNVQFKSNSRSVALKPLNTNSNVEALLKVEDNKIQQ